MTDLLDVLRDLDPVPGPVEYDQATVHRLVSSIVAAPASPRLRPDVLPHTVHPTHLVPGTRSTSRRWTTRLTGRRLAVGAVAALAVALVVTTIGVAVGWVRPLAGQHPPAAGDAATIFGPDIDPATIQQRVIVEGAAPLTLWSASSPALGSCLAVTSDSGGWSAAPAVDAAWRPLAGGAACLDQRVSSTSVGAGFIARFVHGAEQGTSQEVYAGPVTVTGETSARVEHVEVSTSDGALHPAPVVDGLFLTPPVTSGGCPTVVTRNGTGTVLSSDVEANGCPGSPVPVAALRSGSSAPDILLNNNFYPDGLSSGLSALNRRDPAMAAGKTSGMTVLTLSVQFFDACQSPPATDGTYPFPDPCLQRRVAIPTDIDLQLTYGSDHTAAVRDSGRTGPGNDFTSPPTPGYVGGKVFGLLVYRTFLVPTGQLGSLTARWTGDSQHPPLIMTNVQRALK